MSIILSVHARQIFDSRGNPTVEVDVITENGILVVLYRKTEMMKRLSLEMEVLPGKAKSAVTNVNTTIAQEITGTCF